MQYLFSKSISRTTFKWKSFQIETESVIAS